LAAAAVPRLTLGRARDGFTPLLGWNTWLGDGGRLGDRQDALFELADLMPEVGAQSA
jgi:predicted component of type VI protein secretion system